MHSSLQGTKHHLRPSLKEALYATINIASKYCKCLDGAISGWHLTASMSFETHFPNSWKFNFLHWCEWAVRCFYSLCMPLSLPYWWKLNSQAPRLYTRTTAGEITEEVDSTIFVFILWEYHRFPHWFMSITKLWSVCLPCQSCPRLFPILDTLQTQGSFLASDGHAIRSPSHCEHTLLWKITTYFQKVLYYTVIKEIKTLVRFCSCCF